MGKLSQLKTRHTIAVVWLCVAFTVAGCSPDEPSVPVGTLNGVVYSTGKPVANCRVKVFNKQTLKSAMVSVSENAKYEFKGLPLGEYKLAVITEAWHEASQPPIDKRIPKRYRDVKTSGFSMAVKKGENEYNLEMKK